MRIYSMTATFGKLEHATLNLEDDFQIIHAPNEWGKSTWCAFMVAMFYGLETRAKSTKTSLADKDRYAPWSGKPMAGRMDLNWNGRDITLERTTKGRIPMGVFRAYETATGLPVPELTAANCGQMLLGVERSVFLRSGFIRLSDLPVTGDEALRRRLNALVTTGDESSAGDRLAKGLKELKNKIRYNRTGLLPQLEGELGEAEMRLTEIQALRERMDSLRRRQKAEKQWLKKLENHVDALNFAAAEEDARHVAHARQLRDEAERNLQELDSRCAQLPSREELEWGLAKIRELEQVAQTLDQEAQYCAGEISYPEAPAFARNAAPDAVREQAAGDARRYRKLRRPKPCLLILGLTLAAAGLWYGQPPIGFAIGGLGVVVALIGIWLEIRRKAACKSMAAFYGSADPDSWVAGAEAYALALEQTEENRKQRKLQQKDILNRRQLLDDKIFRVTKGKGLVVCWEEWADALACWEALGKARLDWQRADAQLKTLRAMARTAPKPQLPDELTMPMEDTQRLISDSTGQLRQLESRMSQYAGRIEALGDEQALTKKLEELRIKRKKLEDTYAALTVAQEALTQAKQELQRRFAPRISKRAGELMAVMTDGRYDRLQLGEDFSLLAGAEQEDTLREALWRSEGTVDQLYLAMRLAVAEALAPEAPLILDDALVRFDDTRLKAALEILKAESGNKQIILFTCQKREMEI